MKKIKEIFGEWVDAASKSTVTIFLMMLMGANAPAQLIYVPVTGYSLSNLVTIPAGSAVANGTNTPGTTNIGASALSKQFSIKPRAAMGVFTSIFLSGTNALAFGSSSNLAPSMTLSLQPYYDFLGTNTINGSTNWTWTFVPPIAGGAFTNFVLFPIGACDGVKGFQFLTASMQNTNVTAYISNQVYYITEPNQ